MATARVSLPTPARVQHRTDVLYAKCNTCLIETEDNSIWPVMTVQNRCTRCKSQDLDIQFRLSPEHVLRLAALEFLPF